MVSFGGGAMRYTASGMKSDQNDDTRALRREMALCAGRVPRFAARLAADAAGRHGKKRRGTLLLMLGRLFSAPRREAAVCAAAVETVHLATLIHDDILDGATLRRGHPALHRAHGAVPALLYGDVLFTRGFASVSALGRAALTDLLLETASSLCLGEILESRQRGRFPWSGRDYFRIASLKTAPLFAFCCVAPGILADFGEDRLARLRRLGRCLGLACQIADDCLDYLPPGAPREKDALLDLRNGVPNYPLLYAARDPRVRAAVRALCASPPTPARLERLGGLVRRSGAIRHAAGKAARYLREAGDELRVIGGWGGDGAARMIGESLKEQERALELLDP